MFKLLNRMLLTLLAGSVSGLTWAAQDGDMNGEQADDEAASASLWSYYGDVRLRAERITGLPNRRDDFDRALARLRYGVRYESAEGFEFGAALRASVGNDDNRDNRRNLDNERSDAGGLDELYVAYQFTPEVQGILGKTNFPLMLSPMVWDRDLRPIAAAVSGEWETDSGWTIGTTVGYFAGNHLYNDDSRIAAGQLSLRTQLSDRVEGELLLSYLGFSDLTQLVQQQLGRTNRVARGELASDYRLVDAQLIFRSAISDWPLVVSIDGVRNTGAQDQNEGARFSATLGDRRRAGGFEFGYAIERIQRDAVLAAFGEDDWWFKSRLHGYMPWIAYGIDETKSMRLAAFVERRDDLSIRTRRFMLDFNWSL